MSMLDYLAQVGPQAYRESFFAATGTVGTGIVTTDDLPATKTATAPHMTVYNSGTVGAGDKQWIVPVLLRMRATAANTSNAAMHIEIVLDTGNRYSSGGTTLTSKSTSIDTVSGYTDRTPKAVVNFGVITATAATAAKTVGNVPGFDAIADNEVCEMWFGSNAGGSISANTDIFSVTAPPVWIGRNCTMLLYFLAEGSGSNSFDPEVEFYYIETNHPRFNA